MERLIVWIVWNLHSYMFKIAYRGLWISTNSRVKKFYCSMKWIKLSLLSHVSYDINSISSNWVDLDRSLFSIHFFSWSNYNKILHHKWKVLHLQYQCVLTKEISDFLYESSLTPRKFFQCNEVHSTFNHDVPWPRVKEFIGASGGTWNSFTCQLVRRWIGILARTSR